MEDEIKTRKVGLVWEAEVSIGNSIYFFQSYFKKRAIRYAKEEQERYRKK